MNSLRVSKVKECLNTIGKSLDVTEEIKDLAWTLWSDFFLYQQSDMMDIGKDGLFVVPGA